jgi:hypothetical protein
MSETITVRGAVDLHIHSHPSLFPRIADDRAMVESAAGKGMRAIMLKCHCESTVSRARVLDEEYPDISVCGGIVLNSYVGGINPAAVEAALRLGAKEVWMPTVDAAYHALMHGGRTGSYDVQTSGERQTDTQGIAVMSNGRLTDETYQVLDLIAKNDAILGTTHLSPEEILALVTAARERGVEKILITHPFFKVPGLDLAALEDLAKLGAFAEFGYCTASPMWAYSTIDQVKAAVETLGPSRCVLISDGGQRHNPMPVEGLRVFAQCLHEKGLSEDHIRQMIVTNPAELLDLQ